MASANSLYTVTTQVHSSIPFFVSDQAITDPKGNGDGGQTGEASSMLGIRRRGAGASPPDDHQHKIPGYGSVPRQY